jgi:hypothetical protein
MTWQESEIGKRLLHGCYTQLVAGHLSSVLRVQKVAPGQGFEP